MDNVVNNYVCNIISAYESTIRTYENNIDVIKQSDNETQDLLHEIELSAPKNVCDGFRFYKELREVRNRRRQAKDENDVLEEFYSFAKTQHDTKNKLRNIQGNSQKIANTKEVRNYKPKVRSDLTITTIQCTENKPFENMMQNFRKEQDNKKCKKYV